MHYRRMGANGPLVSVVGLGASQFGRACNREQSHAIVDAALDSGITFVDTAEAYPGSEEMLGYALRGRRADVVISTKFGHPWTHPDGGWGRARAVRTSLEGSLRRLQTDYVDCYLMHMPDPQTPIDETQHALNALVHAGKIRYVGVSNFSAAQLTEALAAGNLTCVQNRYNLLERDIEVDILPLCRQYGLGLVPYAPLAAGLLSGRYHRGDQPPAGTRLAERRGIIDEATFDRVAALDGCARRRNLSLLQFAIGWLTAQASVGPVITGATTPEHIRANASAGDWLFQSSEVST